MLVVNYAFWNGIDLVSNPAVSVAVVGPLLPVPVMDQQMALLAISPNLT